MEGHRQNVEDILKTEPIKELGLKFAGIGADKIVFETPGSDRKLVKVSMFVLKNKITNLLHGIACSRTEENQTQKSEIDEQRQYEKNISGIFGSEHLLKKGIFRAKIPLTKEIIAKIAKEGEEHLIEKLDDNVYEVEMLAETQLIADELKNREKFKTKDFHTSLITEEYFRSAKDIPEALSRVREIVDKNFLGECDELFEEEDYKNLVKEIVVKIIEYSRKTGFMIDIFGPDNITIFKKEDGSLDYHLLDAVLPGSQKAWEGNINEDKGLYLLRPYYTFYYSIRTVADKLGISDNLEMKDLVYFKGGEIPDGKFATREDFYSHKVKKQE